MMDGVRQYARGKHCYVFVSPYNENLIIKLFDYQEAGESAKDFFWGDPPKSGGPNMSVSLFDATLIQNICWLHGLAPRVYSIEKVKLGHDREQRFFVQWIERCRNFEENMKDVLEVYNKVKALGDQYGFGNDKDDVSMADVMDGKLIDFNTFHFKDREKLKDKYIEYAKYGKVYYHGVKEWGLSGGPRDNENRVKWMGLGNIDFKNKTVLDLGCAGGYFCKYARHRGAREVLGIDSPGNGSPDPIKGAYLSAWMDGKWGIDFEELDLSKNKPEGVWNIVFFLSMNFHIGIPEWLPEVTGELCIFEDNSKDRNAKGTLEKMFSRVKEVGIAKDHGDKPIYFCYK